MNGAIFRPRAHLRTRGFFLDRRTEAAPKNRARIRRRRNSAARDGVGRSLEVSFRIDPQAGQMGLLGVISPEEYGGAGMGYTEYAIIIEELSRVDGSIGIIVAAHNSLCTNHIYKFGSRRAKKEICRPAGAGQETRLLVAHRAASRLRRRRHAHQSRAKTTAAGSSTARRHSPPMAITRTSA